jgi:regulator of sigma E protease
VFDSALGVLRLLAYGIPVLGVIVFVHELGHFLAARLVGVRVTAFSIGFGKRLFGVRRGGTDYRVCVLPLGGYVKMAGDNVEEERTGAADEFLSRPWWQRVIVALGGPGANLVMAVVCSILVYAFGIQYSTQPNVIGRVSEGSVAAAIGIAPGDSIAAVAGVETRSWSAVVREVSAAAERGEEVGLTLVRGVERLGVSVTADRADSLLRSLTPHIPAVVGGVTSGLPAYRAGLREGDRIVEIAGAEVRDWSDLKERIVDRAGESVPMVVERDGQRLAVTVKPVDQQGEGIIGISAVAYGHEVQRFGLSESILNGVHYTFAVTEQLVAGLGRVFARPGDLGSNLVGPIGIMQMSAEQMDRGRTDLLNWLVLVSIALMVMNLLPIPVLDGGHVLVAVIEAVRRRPLEPRHLVAVWRVGLVLLLALMTFAVANDGLRIFQRTQAERRTVPVESPTDAVPRTPDGE